MSKDPLIMNESALSARASDAVDGIDLSRTAIADILKANSDTVLGYMLQRVLAEEGTREDEMVSAFDSAI